MSEKEEVKEKNERRERKRENCEKVSEKEDLRGTCSPVSFEISASSAVLKKRDLRFVCFSFSQSYFFFVFLFFSFLLLVQNYKRGQVVAFSYDTR
jgi:hypothetical protein